MKRIKVAYGLLCIMVMVLTGCSRLPLAKKIRVARDPRPGPYMVANNMALSDGYAPSRSWSVAFADRDNNSTQVSPKNDRVQKRLAYLQPLYILRRKGDYVKVAECTGQYNMDETKGWVPRKGLKRLGWMREERLLLWTAGLKETASGFQVKAIANVADASVVTDATRYFSNDSLALFSSPELIRPMPVKLAPGQLIYLYKQSEDKKSYLVGRQPFVLQDSIKQDLLGWISVQAISIWGTRAAFTYNDITETDSVNGLFLTQEHAHENDTMPILPLSRLEERSRFENIFPLSSATNADSNLLRTRYLENVLDYSNNKVFNVLGKPLYYNRYRDILRSANRLNVVFVVDAGLTNKLYLPSVKSVLQDIQLFFDTVAYFKTSRFGAVMYKRTKCAQDTIAGTYGLTKNYTDIIRFIDRKEQFANCEDAELYQPVNWGITQACNLLNRYRDETNVIVVVGTTGDRPGANLGDMAAGISKVQARLLYFQTINRSADAYNDFVLAAEKTVVASSQNLALQKKEKLVNVADVIMNNAYSLQAGDSGSYYLDYPAKSMTQGFVTYPRKGDVMMPGVLKKNFDTLMSQVMADNKAVSHSLRTYFKSNIGVSQTVVKPAFAARYAGMPDPVPVNFAKLFTEMEPVCLVPAYALRGGAESFGALLSEGEYNKVIRQFEEVYALPGANLRKFYKRAAVRSYIRYLNRYRKAQMIDVSKRRIKRMTLAGSLQLYTGYIAADSLWNTVQLRQLKRRNRNEAAVFFKRFDEAAKAMVAQKNSAAVRIDCKGTTYYWIDKRIMP